MLGLTPDSLAVKIKAAKSEKKKLFQRLRRLVLRLAIHWSHENM